MMTPEREELIRDHWNRWRGEWPEGMPALRMPVKKPFPAPTWDVSEATYEELDILEFRREYGRQDGRKARRTVCEGVVVELVYE